MQMRAGARRCGSKSLSAPRLHSRERTKGKGATRKVADAYEALVGLVLVDTGDLDATWRAFRADFAAPPALVRARRDGTGTIPNQGLVSPNFFCQIWQHS